MFLALEKKDSFKNVCQVLLMQPLLTTVVVPLQDMFQILAFLATFLF